MPGLERLAQFDFSTAALRNRRTSGSGTRNAARTSRGCSAKPGRILLGDDVREILLDEVRQHEAVVQLGAPARQPRRLRRARARSAPPASAAAAAAPGSCARAAAFRRRASPAGPAGRSAPSGEYSLSMQNSARCVLPVTSISRLRNSRSTSHGGHSRARFRQLAERDLELVQRVVARLVDARRLRGRADEQAREQVRQRRMVVPVGRAGCAADPAGAGTASRRAWRRRARSDCRRRCRCGGRRA